MEEAGQEGRGRRLWPLGGELGGPGQVAPAGVGPLLLPEARPRWLLRGGDEPCYLGAAVAWGVEGVGGGACCCAVVEMEVDPALGVEELDGGGNGGSGRAMAAA